MQGGHIISEGTCSLRVVNHRTTANGLPLSSQRLDTNSVSAGRPDNSIFPPALNSEIFTGAGGAARSFLDGQLGALLGGLLGPMTWGGSSRTSTHPLSTRKESRQTLIFFFK